MGKKKILVLASTFPRWKNDTTPPFIFELEKRLNKNFNIFALVPHFKNAKKSEVLDGLKIYRFQYFWPSKLQQLCYEGGILPKIKKNKLLIFQAYSLLICELVAAIKIIKREKIDLIHAHWIIPQGIVAVLLYKLFKVPFIITTHGGDIYGLKSGPMKSLKKFILKNAQTITVVSHDIKKEVLNLNPSLKVDVVSMGVDSTVFHPKHRDLQTRQNYQISGPFLLFVGRLVEKKGVEYLIKAMKDIIKAFPTTKLLIVGEGTLETRLKELTKNLQLDQYIIFTGSIPNQELPKWYASADIFIGPSIHTSGGDTEGLGLTFIEAAFSGCIPVGSNVGGISDVIKTGQTGILVEEKDPQSIAEAVIRLIKDRKMFNKIKGQSRQLTMEKYDWVNVSKKYQEFYLN